MSRHLEVDREYQECFLMLPEKYIIQSTVVSNAYF